MTVLELIKSRDSMQNLILFIKSEEAQRVMAAWPMMGASCTDRELKKGETLGKASMALWAEANETYSMDDLATQAEVPSTICERLVSRLTRASIIYPDGTISPNASNLLVTESIAHLRSRNPRGKPYEGSRLGTAGEGVPKSDSAGLQTGRAPQPGADKARHEPPGKHGVKAR